VLVAALFILLSAGWLPANPLPAYRLGIWVIRDQLTSRLKVDSLFTTIAGRGVSDLFVQVRGRGDAFYRSELVPRAAVLQNRFWDPLEYLLEQAHARDIKVHAWLNTFFIWSAADRPADYRHVLRRYPEWTAVNSAGKQDGYRTAAVLRSEGSDGIYLSPLAVDVREHLKAVIRELIEQYDVDGIHLDYLRYPNPNYGYHYDARIEFEQQEGIDPLDLWMPESGEKAELAPYRERWEQYRRDRLSDFVREVKLMLFRSNRPLQYSAAVKANRQQAGDYYLQDWGRWIEEGWIDFVIPMNYASDTQEFEQNIASFDISPIYQSRIWMGIAAFNQSHLGIYSKTRISHYRGFPNLVYFSYASFAKDPAIFNSIGQALDEND